MAGGVGVWGPEARRVGGQADRYSATLGQGPGTGDLGPGTGVAVTSAHPLLPGGHSPVPQCLNIKFEYTL